MEVRGVWQVQPIAHEEIYHPEFVQGVCDCQERYFDYFDEAPLTEEEMMEEVETNLSRRTAKVDQQTAAMFGGEAPTYLEKLGWVIGTIAKGLSYDQAQQLALAESGQEAATDEHAATNQLSSWSAHARTG